MTTKFCFIDTCHVEYLQDHHNRPNELLLGVECLNDTTRQEIRDTLLFQAPRSDLVDGSTTPDDADLARIINAFFDVIGDPSTKWNDTVQCDGGNDDDETAEWPKAWFLLTWD